MSEGHSEGPPGGVRRVLAMRWGLKFFCQILKANQTTTRHPIATMKVTLSVTIKTNQFSQVFEKEAPGP